MKARGAGESAHLLLDVSAVLAENDVEYAVIGAMAAAVYGAIRATTDADALLSVSIAKLGQLEKIFKKAGFLTELRRGDADDPIPALLSVSDRHDNRVDLLAGLRGLDRLALSRSITVPFRGSSLRVIGREDFVAMRPKRSRPPLSPSIWSCCVGPRAVLEDRPQTCWRGCCGCDDERPG
jgi:hypothetical protein